MCLVTAENGLILGSHCVFTNCYLMMSANDIKEYEGESMMYACIGMPKSITDFDLSHYDLLV